MTTVNGTTTLTTYIGGIEEVQTSGSTTTTPTYYSVGGQRVAAKVNGTFYYFGYDALGSKVAVFNDSGNLIGSQLYDPYGNQRYANGSLPTSIGFTGQQADTTTGLDYYGARYYDPMTGQFLSADTVQGNAQGANPYAYVEGNPETLTDPTGHMVDPVAEAGEEVAGVPDAFYDAFNDDNPGSLDPSLPASPDITTFDEDGATWDYYASTGEVTETTSSFGDSFFPGDPGYAAILAQYQAAQQSYDSSQNDTGKQFAVNSRIMGPYQQQQQQQQQQQPQSSGSSGGGKPPSRTTTGGYSYQDNNNIVRVFLYRNRYPESCQHIEDAIQAGQPSVLTVARSLAKTNRAASLKGIPIRSGFQRDEYPLAMTQEGGAGADVRYINPSDNQGAGSTIKEQLRGYNDGTQFTIECV